MKLRRSKSPHTIRRSCTRQPYGKSYQNETDGKKSVLRLKWKVESARFIARILKEWIKTGKIQLILYRCKGILTPSLWAFRN